MQNREVEVLLRPSFGKDIVGKDVVVPPKPLVSLYDLQQASIQ